MKFYLTREDGYTLIEIVISLAILLLVVMAFTSLFTFSVSGIFSSGEKSKTLYELQEKVEKAEDEGWGEADLIDDDKEIFFSESGIEIDGHFKTVKETTEDGKEVSVYVFVPVEDE